MDLIASRAELSLALVALHAQHGAVSVRTMEQRVEARAGELGSLSRSTAHRIITRQTIPTTVRILAAFLHACGVPDNERPAWIEAFKHVQRAHHAHNPHAATAHRSDDDAEMLLSSHGFEPAEAYRGDHAAWSCWCTGCRQLLRVRLTDLAQGRGGCRRCGLRTQDPDDPALRRLRRLRPLLWRPEDACSLCGAALEGEADCSYCILDPGVF